MPKSSSLPRPSFAARARKSGHSSLRAFRSWQSLSCVWGRLRVLGSIVDTCAHVSWRLLDDSRLFDIIVDLGSWDDSRPCSAVSGNWISVLRAVLGSTVDTSSSISNVKVTRCLSCMWSTGKGVSSGDDFW